MKLILILAILAFGTTVVHAQDIMTTFFNSMLQCQQNTSVTAEIVQKILSLEFTFDTDQPGKCFIQCFCLAFNWCAQDGQIETKAFGSLITSIDQTKVSVPNDNVDITFINACLVTGCCSYTTV